MRLPRMKSYNQICTKLAHFMKFCHLPRKSHIKHDAYRFCPVVCKVEKILLNNAHSFKNHAIVVKMHVKLATSKAGKALSVCEKNGKSIF